MKDARYLLGILCLAVWFTAGIPERVFAAGTPNTWTTQASLITARAYVGVTAGAGADTHLYAIGGQSSGSSWLRTAESLSPGGGSWTSLTNSYGVTAAGLGMAAGSDSKLYGMGGDSSGTASKTAYSDPNPSTTAWTALTNSMPTARTHLAAARAPSTGLIYAIGGNSGTSYLASNEAYSTTTATWSTKASMPTARAYLAVVTGPDGLIYAIGGRNSSSYLATVEAYNPSTNTWACSVGDASSGCSSSNIAPMPTARTATAAVANGIIYVFGGTGNGTSFVSTVEAYNPVTNQWECSTGDAATGCSATSITAMTTPRGYAGSALASDGNIYVVGGYNGSTYLTTVESYGPMTVPGAPTSVNATAGDGTASVGWTAPAGTGGSALTSYTVSCSPACTSVTSASTPATVTGLTNGTSYTFTVTARNFVGTGSSSSPSNSVTPSCSTGAGTLGLSGASIGNFAVTLTGSDQNVYTSLGPYTASNTTCSGWYVQMQATRLTNSGGDSFPYGSLLMPPPTVSTCQSSCGSGSGANAPTICLLSTTALDSASATTIASAASGTGKGSYTFTPATIGTGNLQLKVPSYAYATSYSSTLTVTIVQGPATTC